MRIHILRKGRRDLGTRIPAAAKNKLSRVFPPSRNSKARIAFMDDEDFIRRTLELAQQGLGLTSPGAMVGAVIVRDGQVIGEGFYTYDLVRHAEIIALEQAGEAARGATMYT